MECISTLAIQLFSYKICAPSEAASGWRSPWGGAPPHPRFLSSKFSQAQTQSNATANSYKEALSVAQTATQKEQYVKSHADSQRSAPYWRSGRPGHSPRADRWRLPPATCSSCSDANSPAPLWCCRWQPAPSALSLIFIGRNWNWQERIWISKLKKRKEVPWKDW